MLSGQAEIEEGSEKMVIGTDVDTVKMTSSSVTMSTHAKNLLQIFDTIAAKELSMNVKKVTRPILEATLLMVVLIFYLLEPKVPPIYF